MRSMIAAMTAAALLLGLVAQWAGAAPAAWRGSGAAEHIAPTVTRVQRTNKCIACQNTCYRLYNECVAQAPAGKDDESCKRYWKQAGNCKVECKGSPVCGVAASSSDRSCSGCRTACEARYQRCVTTTKDPEGCWTDCRKECKRSCR